MRIVSWNCCKGQHRIKLPPLLTLRPGIAALQESPKPTEKLAESQLWHGTNERQGVLLLAFDGWRLEQVGELRREPQFFIPARAIGPRESFNVLAIWVKPGSKPPLYVSTIREGFEEYEAFIKSGPTVVLGDRNTDLQVEEIEQRLGLVSAYHEFFDVDYGRERHPTLYHGWNREKRYHFDYCFLPKAWRRRINRVQIGGFNQWTRAKLSDHCPVIVDVGERRKQATSPKQRAGAVGAVGIVSAGAQRGCCADVGGASR